MKTITFADSKGGVGKSTLLWNTAIALQMTGYDVAIIDHDAQQLTITHTNNARSFGNRDMMTVLHIDTIEMLSQFLSDSQHDFVLIDLGGYDYDLGRVAMSLSDRIVIPLGEEPTEIFAVSRFLGVLRDMAEISPIPSVMIVITRAHPRASKFPLIHEASALWSSATIASTIMRRRAIYSASMGHGFGVTELSERHPDAADEMYRLAREIVHGEAQS